MYIGGRIYELFIVNVESFELNVAYIMRVEQVLINTISNFNETRNPEMDKSVYGSINKL